MKYVFIAAIAAIIALGILGLIDASALNAPDRPKRVKPHAQASAEGPPGTVSGHAYDAQSGQPLVGVTVVVEPTESGMVTDAQGAYKIINVPTGKYKVSADHMGYIKLWASATLNSVSGLRVDFWLAPFVIEAGKAIR